MEEFTKENRKQNNSITQVAVIAETKKNLVSLGIIYLGVRNSV